MTDGMFCAQCLSQYQEILSKTRLFGTRNCSNWVDHCSERVLSLSVSEVNLVSAKVWLLSSGDSSHCVHIPAVFPRVQFSTQLYSTFTVHFFESSFKMIVDSG